MTIIASTSKSPDPLVLQNQLAVSLSQKRKLISSWLPPPTADELVNQKSAEDIVTDENDIWKSRPATLGVGHPIPSSSSIADAYNHENDLLRRRLLGQSSLKDARQRHLERTKPRKAVDDDGSSSSDGEQVDRGGTVKNSVKRRRLKEESNSSSERENVDFDSKPSKGEREETKGGFILLMSKTPAKNKNKAQGQQISTSGPASVQRKSVESDDNIGDPSNMHETSSPHNGSSVDSGFVDESLKSVKKKKKKKRRRLTHLSL
ncbi:hypothetical protein H072_3240 [Dactylellina haptotyla CBS 200.50]|uniref:Uncharacterized protein n=1 Tax=Dactylellina haptotyla (strain CBS 200.50) TaxID=1284197 RepID=S8C4X9_DACHA|nr:hypothetical protein H072_3240 [Dactylellina haptotyla CBS 200.50]